MKILMLIVTVFIVASAYAEDIPENAHKNMRSNGWDCNKGYHRSGDGCVRVIIPENAHLNLYGNGWDCNKGYHRSGDGCVRVIIPENAHLNLYGNGWDCDRGFARSEARCTIVQIPRNGELDFTGHSWRCLRGYERDGNVCRPFTIPENAVMRLDGNGWICNLRFKRSGNECVAMTEQEIAFQNLLIMRARACGKSYNYDVSGYCGGEYVYGNVDACSQSKEVTGHVTFDNGAEMDFTGEWISKGEIEGTDGFGNSCDLEVD